MAATRLLVLRSRRGQRIRLREELSVELYSREISPFAARVRVSVLAKNLPIRIIHDPDVSSDAFGRLNPLRRVPVLVLDDGTAIPESEAIVEYLEDAYPNAPLRPAELHARTRSRLVSRISELYVFPAVVPLFAALATGDQPQIDKLFGQLEQALRNLSSFMRAEDASWHACGDRLSTADGALAPFLFYVQVVGQACGRAPLGNHTRLQRFWDGAQQEPVLSAVIAQLAHAFHARR
jgi:glutathione S-transferase